MRRISLLVLCAAGAAVFILAGCQTAKPVSAEQSTITAESSGFAPDTHNGQATIGFTLPFPSMPNATRSLRRAASRRGQPEPLRRRGPGRTG